MSSKFKMAGISRGVVALFIMAGIAGTADAAFLATYGDFPADTVDYLDTTEKNNANTALYGSPQSPVVNDMLTFATTGDFRAEAPTSSGADSETTSGRLEFMLDGRGQDLLQLLVVEGGDYGWTALAGSSSLVSATLNVRVFDMDKQTLLLTKNVVFSDDLIPAGSASVLVDDWELTADVDLSGLNRDKLFIVINNNLAAVVDGPSTTFIEKKNFKVTGVATEIPEPGALALMGIGSLMLIYRRRAA